MLKLFSRIVSSLVITSLLMDSAIAHPWASNPINRGSLTSSTPFTHEAVVQRLVFGFRNHDAQSIETSQAVGRYFKFGKRSSFGLATPLLLKMAPAIMAVILMVGSPIPAYSQSFDDPNMPIYLFLGFIVLVLGSAGIYFYTRPFVPKTADEYLQPGSNAFHGEYRVSFDQSKHLRYVNSLERVQKLKDLLSAQLADPIAVDAVMTQILGQIDRLSEEVNYDADMGSGTTPVGIASPVELERLIIILTEIHPNFFHPGLKGRELSHRVETLLSMRENPITPTPNDPKIAAAETVRFTLRSFIADPYLICFEPRTEATRDAPLKRIQLQLPLIEEITNQIRTGTFNHGKGLRDVGLEAHRERRRVNQVAVYSGQPRDPAIIGTLHRDVVHMLGLSHGAVSYIILSPDGKGNMLVRVRPPSKSKTESLRYVSFFGFHLGKPEPLKGDGGSRGTSIAPEVPLYVIDATINHIESVFAQFGPLHLKRNQVYGLGRSVTGAIYEGVEKGSLEINREERHILVVRPGYKDWPIFLNAMKELETLQRKYTFDEYARKIVSSEEGFGLNFWDIRLMPLSTLIQTAREGSWNVFPTEKVSMTETYADGTRQTEFPTTEDLWQWFVKIAGDGVIYRLRNLANAEYKEHGRSLPKHIVLPHLLTAWIAGIFMFFSLGHPTPSLFEKRSSESA